MLQSMRSDGRQRPSAGLKSGLSASPYDTRPGSTSRHAARRNAEMPERRNAGSTRHAGDVMLRPTNPKETPSMAIYELRTYDVIVGKMADVVALYKAEGYPARPPRRDPLVAVC
jgi:hypothetical protein